MQRVLEVLLDLQGVYTKYLLALVAQTFHEASNSFAFLCPPPGELRKLSLA